VGPGLQEATLGWSVAANGQADVRFELPAGSRNVTGYDELSFRTMTDPGYDANQGITYQDFDVIVEDTNGARAAVAASDVGNDVLRNEFSGRRRGATHLIMNQIRFPLSAFSGVDLSHVAAVELSFDRVSAGVIHVSDLAFQRTS
jgi:hypothetical protein